MVIMVEKVKKASEGQRDQDTIGEQYDGFNFNGCFHRSKKTAQGL